LFTSPGLSFPYSDPDRSLASRGIGPTQNSDLWIANEAVFIDVAGRYSLVESDKETWLGFLDQIKRLRRDKPLDGILLTVDIASLLRAGNDERRDLAKKLRARLDEMTQRLGMLVPVYLLFSKSDQLEGFAEFFRDLCTRRVGAGVGVYVQEGTISEPAIPSGISEGAGSVVQRPSLQTDHSFDFASD
jgi:type VI secretion system protein ImpL